MKLKAKVYGNNKTSVSFVIKFDDYRETYLTRSEENENDCFRSFHFRHWPKRPWIILEVDLRDGYDMLIIDLRDGHEILHRH